MKHILAVLCVCSMLFCKAQESNLVHKVVLQKDNIKIFGVDHLSYEFGESYFVCLQEYNYSFTDAGFEQLKTKLYEQGPDIKAFKAADNKSIICIFPKLSTRGVGDIQEFIAKKFDDSVMSQIRNKRTVHVQVVDTYNRLDREQDRGFSFN